MHAHHWGYSVGKAEGGANADRADADDRRSRYVLADGVSRSYDPPRWAELVSECACVLGTPRDHDSAQRFIATAQWQWKKERRELLQQGQVYVLSHPRARVSSTTLLNVCVDLSKEWLLSALGDTCVFLVREHEVIHQFPYTCTSEFDRLAPPQFTTIASELPLLHDSVPARDGDIAILATDELSKAIMHELEAGSMDLVHRLLAINSQRKFERFVDDLRCRPTVDDDDMTCMFVALGSAASADITDRCRRFPMSRDGQRRNWSDAQPRLQPQLRPQAQPKTNWAIGVPQSRARAALMPARVVESEAVSTRQLSHGANAAMDHDSSSQHDTLRHSQIEAAAPAVPSMSAAGRASLCVAPLEQPNPFEARPTKHEVYPLFPSEIPLCEELLLQPEPPRGTTQPEPAHEHATGHRVLVWDQAQCVDAGAVEPAGASPATRLLPPPAASQRRDDDAQLVWDGLQIMATIAYLVVIVLCVLTMSADQAGTRRQQPIKVEDQGQRDVAAEPARAVPPPLMSGPPTEPSPVPTQDNIEPSPPYCTEHPPKQTPPQKRSHTGQKRRAKLFPAGPREAVPVGMARGDTVPVPVAAAQADVNPEGSL